MYIISNDTAKDVQLLKSENESTPGACPSLLFNCTCLANQDPRG